MQKTFVKIISRKILTAAFLTGAVVMDASAENKELNNNMEIVSTNIQSNVEFAGNTDNTFLFDVKVVNPDGDTFTLEVQDDNGEVLFSKNYTETNLVKKVKLLNEEITAHYNFIIRTNNKEPEQTFVVSITTKAVEDAEAAYL
jgi:hypothetical protein